MSILYGNRDRAKASEHALFLVRELPAPAPLAAAALPQAASRRDDLSVTLSSTDWRITIHDIAARGDLFEGVIRFERDSPTSTQVVLLGRFFPPAIPVEDDAARRRAYEDTENAVTGIFESLLDDVSRALAPKTSYGSFASAPGR